VTFIKIQVGITIQFLSPWLTVFLAPVVAMFVNGSGQNEHLYIGPSIDASYQISDQLAFRFYFI
jgi:hypothetical protein